MIVSPFQPKDIKDPSKGGVHDNRHEFEVHVPKKQSGEFRQNARKNNPMFVMKTEYALNPDRKRIIHVGKNRIKIIPGRNIHRIAANPIKIGNTAYAGCRRGKKPGRM